MTAAQYSGLSSEIAYVGGSILLVLFVMLAYVIMIARRGRY